MKSFKDIQKGDVLLRRNRRFNAGDCLVEEWVEVIVENVTRAYYFVNGEKYRKDSEGKSFMNNFYFPGQSGAPEKATPDGEFNRIIDLYKKCNDLKFVHPGLENINNLEKRAELADKLHAVLEEIKSHS